MPMLITTDSVMPMKFTIESAAMNSRVTSRAGGAAHSSAKYDANPDASDPAAAKLADRNDTVTRKVSVLLPNALLT